MRIVVQLSSVLLALYLFTTILRGRKSHTGRAIKKIGFFLLIIAIVITVFFPWIVDEIAYFVGVSSGVNLFVYLLGAGFVIFVLNNYMHQQDQRDIQARLARRIAIIEATERYKGMMHDK